MTAAEGAAGIQDFGHIAATSRLWCYPHMNQQPLDDIVVLDFGQVYNGPYCGFLLAQAGSRHPAKALALGADTNHILMELAGVDETDLPGLRSRQVIG